jgi:hypothetical protein
MFSFEEYIIGWAVYLLAVLGILAVFWRMTRAIPWFYVKQSLRLIVATLFLVPTFVEKQITTASMEYLAPAWVKGVLQLVFSSPEKALPVGKMLLICILGAYIFYLLLLIVQYLLQQHKLSRKQKSKPKPTS